MSQRREDVLFDIERHQELKANYRAQMGRPQTSEYHIWLEVLGPDSPWVGAPIFLVGHDLAAVIEEEVGDDSVAPFPLTVFEFRFSARPVFYCTYRRFNDSAVALVSFLGGHVEATTFLIKPDGQWGVAFFNSMSPSEVEEIRARQIPTQALFDLCREQVFAACICLEAGVVEPDLVKAPAEKNRYRIGRGLAPYCDYHELKVRAQARRERDAPGGEVPSHRKRLHFRRGHWHHYWVGGEKTRKWVEWMLVGDPDLGFIDKHYRLDAASMPRRAAS